MPKVYLSPERRPAPHAPYYGFPGVYEHDVCVEIGAYCAEALTRCGFDVMIGSPDKTMQERVAESIAWKSNLHMPIHTNASTATLKEGTAQGPTVLRYGRAGGISDRACQMVYRRLMEIYPRNTHRGVYQKDEFYEIGRTPMLSIYPEIAFHDNGQDAIWIVQNKKRIAEALCKGVCDWFGVTYKEEEKPQTDYDKLLAELEEIKEKYRTEHASAQALRGRILAAIEQYDTAAREG
jgi:N-acetylmuramoyl-L-alanine amidase